MELDTGSFFRRVNQDGSEQDLRIDLLWQENKEDLDNGGILLGGQL